MIQNPSKYHPNPLSHFLNLHNSVANHHLSSAHTNHHHHNYQSINHHHHQLNSQDVTTSLDVGKSFTIAAILGLQKNAIENSQKELNSVMNLSLNGQQHSLHQKGSGALVTSDGVSNNNNNNNNNLSNNSSALNVNSFDCDSLNAASVVQRYLPVVNGVSCANQTTHLRLNHFGHHIGTGTASGQSALQSLQQLHQHHAQQASLGFQNREKAKSDHSKKSSLKSKRVRTIFTPEQLERLEAEFERQQYMVGPERLYLAHTLQLTEAQVKVWFQNRRIKWRKHHLEITQQRLALIRQRQIPSTDVEANQMGPANNPANSTPNHLRRSESDLSICNDSLDTESNHEGEDG